MRQFTEKTLVIASRNAGKLKEIRKLLAPYVEDVRSAADFNLDEVAETGNTFIANANLKSIYTARATGFASLADDSGLMVNALHGAPGVQTANWAGAPVDNARDYQRAMQRIHDELDDAQDRSAKFVTTLSLAWPDGHVEIVEGAVTGWIVWPSRGSNGFGYDPIFQPDGFAETFAEMNSQQKQALSHRADAFRKLLARCF